MKTFKLDYVKEAMEGCVNNDYKMICRAAKLLDAFSRGCKIDCEDNVENIFKTSLYRKFMRAYTRYILSNPNIIKDISIDCMFTSMHDGEYTGIDE